MRLRFTIRDLLWLTALVALAIGWWLDHSMRQQSTTPATLQDWAQSQIRELETWRNAPGRTAKQKAQASRTLDGLRAQSEILTAEGK
jgi:hypothetical protein